MAEQLNLQINVNGNASESVKSLKKELREAQASVAILSDKFGSTSKEAIEAAKRAAELKDRIGDAKALTEAFNPDAKFKALSASLTGVASGFTAVQGAIGLFGSESKELEKQLLKVQSALAFSQGLQGLFESVDSFKNLATVIKSQVITAFSTLRGAIVATGIGALVVGIGLLISNFEKVKKFVNDLIPGLSGFATAVGKIVNRITDFAGITSEAGRQISKTISDNESAIKKTETFLKLNGDKYDEYTKRKIQANLEYKKNVNDILKDETLKTAEKDALIKQAREKANRDILKSDQERADAQEEIRRKQSEKAEAERQKEQQRIDARDKKVEENKARLININNQEKEERKKRLDDQIELDKKNEENNQKNIQSIVDRAKATAAGVQAEANYLSWKADYEKKLDEDAIKLKKQKLASDISMAQETLSIIGGLVDQNSAAGKGIAIAQAIINTYQGASKAIAQGGIFGPVAAAASIAAGFIQVKKIISTKVPSAKGGGTVDSTSTPSMSGSAAPITPSSEIMPTTSLNQATINAMGNQAVKAYVVETDMTTNQQRIQAIKQRARFG